MIPDNTATSAYDDIINRHYTGVTSHTPMPREARAGQFAPFAALPLKRKSHTIKTLDSVHKSTEDIP